jgi:3-phenylpropionate/cinnamic acid dioxygenase small subunit
VESDRGAIENLLARYCQVYDDGDLEAYAALFEGATIDGPLGTLVGAKEVFETQSRTCIMYDGIPRTRHCISNISIDVATDGFEATASCYVTIFQQTPDLPLQPIYVGQYVDQLRKVHGEWRFYHRTAIPFLFGAVEHHSRHASVPAPS